MKMYDVTLPIFSNMVVWPGDPGTKIEIKTTVKKYGVGLSRFQLSSHIGTHVDAPSHFLEDGITLNKVSLAKCIGPCRVLDIRHIKEKIIPQSVFKNLKIKKGDRLLLKTANVKLLGRKEFVSDYVSLSLEAAQFLAKKKINLIGIDYLGIEKKSAPGHPVHKTLLKAGIVIIEGVDLSKVSAGLYQLYCLPLNVIGVDGASARTILISSD